MSECVPLLAGVIGWPINHSRSPRLHGHWLARYGISGHYVPMAVRPGELAAALAAQRQLGFRGTNVTIPHKEEALALASEVTEAARIIGAANTLVHLAEGGFRADNTDGMGFLANLRQEAPSWDPRSGPALVLGAGGAARGVVWALLDAGAPEVRLANRSRERAIALRDSFGPRVVAIDWAEAAEAVAGAAVIVNTTSVGMGGEGDLPVSLDRAEAGALVTDIVYTPLVTPLLAAARARGLATVDGLGMLLHQAAPGFEAWFGRRPEVDAELRAAVLGS
jgi:shikimate dehydrogenase